MWGGRQLPVQERNCCCHPQLPTMYDELIAFAFHSVNDAEITGMYTQLIKKNEKMPDPRAGSTPVLGGTLISPLCLS